MIRDPVCMMELDMRQTGAMAVHIGKDTGALLVYESDPVVLVEKLLKTYSERHYHRPSCFCAEALSKKE